MEQYKTYLVRARSWGMRLVRHHEFEALAKSEEDCARMVEERWPDMFDVQIERK